jgi:predicted TIM-barrel fold metal-dependent hydrolase
VAEEPETCQEKQALATGGRVPLEQRGSYQMRVDVHTHIFPPQVVRDKNSFFSGEPIFKLLYESPKAKLATVESLLEVMDHDGVDHAVVFGFPWAAGELTVRHNDYVLEAASKHSPRLIPLGCVNPLAKDGLREAQRCLASGAKGLGELAIYSECDAQSALKNYADLIECCRAYKGILLVHANEPVGHLYPGKAPLGLDFYYGLARLAAGMPLILAHWGGGICFFELLKKEAAQVLRSVYYDTAASPYLYQPTIYSLMAKAIGADKILFGSDYPLLRPQRYFQEIAQADLTQKEIEAIEGQNALRLFQLR